MILRRVGPMSCGKITGALYACLGLFVGLLFALLALVGSSASATDAFGALPFLGAIFGVGAIAIVPLLYGVIGFLGGLIGAAIYNRLAGLLGGIEVEFQ